MLILYPKETFYGLQDKKYIILNPSLKKYSVDDNLGNRPSGIKFVFSSNNVHMFLILNFLQIEIKPKILQQ